MIRVTFMYRTFDTISKGYIMTILTKDLIMTKTLSLFARTGYEGFSMRTIAKECNVNLSSIYHFFNDKDSLLKAVFDATNTSLGADRDRLRATDTASEMLKQRIVFQFNHIERVIFVLKYYLHFRPQFIKLDSGYIPSKAYLHIEEVLERGNATGEFTIPKDEIVNQSKVIAHAINGFLLEYYPNKPKGVELEGVVASIHQFLIRSLTNKEVLVQ